jgi:MOSC domain-containing protein
VDARTLKVVTQREEPRLASAAAVLAGAGGLRLTAPGMPPLEVGAPGPEPGPLETVRMLSDKVDVVPVAGAADGWFSAYLGTPVLLVHLDEPAVRRPVDPDFALPGDTVSLADGFPLLITAVSSLDSLNSLIAEGDRAGEGPLPMNRFRPNVVVEGTEAWAEDDWQRVRIGEVTFRVPKPCGRCVITTTDQETGERGNEPLRTLGRHRNFGTRLLFGQNMIPESPGTLRVGDPLTRVE